MSQNRLNGSGDRQSSVENGNSVFRVIRRIADVRNTCCQIHPMAEIGTKHHVVSINLSFARRRLVCLIGQFHLLAILDDWTCTIPVDRADCKFV